MVKRCGCSVLDGLCVDESFLVSVARFFSKAKGNDGSCHSRELMSKIRWKTCLLTILGIASWMGSILSPRFSYR